MTYTTYTPLLSSSCSCSYLILFLSFHTELPPQSSQGAQYDNSLWGHLPANRSATSAATSTNTSYWDQLIIDHKDTEAWPSITLSQGQTSPGGCPLDTDPGHLTSSSSSSTSSTNSSSSCCSTASMAAGANSQTGHFPANLSSKVNSGPGPANHTGTNMQLSQVAGNRSWGSGSGPSHCPTQPSVGSERKSDSPVGGGGSRGWGSSQSSSTTNFNLNLNPNANPSAWPVLGHDGGCTGGGSSGGANTNSPPQPTPNLCNPPGPQPSQTSTCTGANTNGNSSGIGSVWGSIMTSDTSEQHPSLSTNVSFSSEPQNLKTDGPNHTNKQEPPSPIHNLPGWGGAPVGSCSMGQQPTGGTQVNGEDGISIWGNSGDSKAPSAKETSGWNSGWGHGGGAGNSGGWGDQSKGEWGKQHTEEAQGGWDGPNSPPQDPQAGPWSRAVSTAVASEGSSDSIEGHPQCGNRSSRDNPPPLPPAQDLDPRVLCNTGWGQTPVRQHTTWDMDNAKQKNDGASESWGSGPTAPSNAQGPSNTNMGPPQRNDSVSKKDVPASQGASSWGGSIAANNHPGSSWGDTPNNIKSPGGPGGWGNPPKGGPAASIPKNSGQSWGEEKSTGWEDSHIKPTSQGWAEQPKASHNWGNSGGSNNTGDWREADESKKNPTNPGWEGEARGWKENPRGWGMATSGPGISGAGNGGWGEPACQRPTGPPEGWTGKSQDGPTASSGGGIGSWGGSGSVKQSGGWSGSKQESSAEPTGWEEPSPPSVRRKMEIDDGTSAWGDPVTYKKTVNLWDRNNPGMSQDKPTTGGNNPPGPNSSHAHSHNHNYHGPPAPLQNHTQNSQNPGPTSAPMDPVMQHQPGPSHNRAPMIAQGKKNIIQNIF